MTSSVLAGMSSELSRQNIFDVLGAQARGGAGHVDGHVAAAYHDGAAGHGLGGAAVLLLLGHVAQEVNGHGHALGVLAGDAGQATALATDGYVEGLEALLAQLDERTSRPTSTP